MMLMVELICGRREFERNGDKYETYALQQRNKDDSVPHG